MYLHFNVYCPDAEERNNQANPDFCLTVNRAWWEGTQWDLHLQFAVESGVNICPHMNSKDEEMVIPVCAKEFRVWLSKKTGRPYLGCNLRVSSFMLEDSPNAPIPPVEAAVDLVKSWDSPNR